MKLEDSINEYVNICNSIVPESSSIIDKRNAFSIRCELFDKDVYIPDVSIENRKINNVPVRVYDSGKSTCLVYFHGGGWMIGDLDSTHTLLAEIAHNCGMTVIAVDYRLAPEHVYPAAHEDGWAVVDSLKSEYNIIAGGDSAGANIAASCAIKYDFIKGLLLICPALGGDLSLHSYTKYKNAPMLPTDAMKYFYKNYFESDKPLYDELASPIQCKTFEIFPPTIIMPAEIDPLHDDAILFHYKLLEKNVKSTLLAADGTVHGFLRGRHMFPYIMNAFNEMCDHLTQLKE